MKSPWRTATVRIHFSDTVNYDGIPVTVECDRPVTVGYDSETAPDEVTVAHGPGSQPHSNYLAEM